MLKSDVLFAPCACLANAVIDCKLVSGACVVASLSVARSSSDSRLNTSEELLIW